ncbi:MAG: hypothetical protein ACK5LN_13960 [Propioniciclava sp.]
MTMTATLPQPGAPSFGRRMGTLLLALLAHALVGVAWLITALAVMGSLDVLRKMLMNSEFAWDTGRLPQPWVIPIGIVAIWVSHRLFGWAMRRCGRRKPWWGPSVIAWSGAFLGVALGAYLAVPPLQVGQQVGPAAGQSTPWGILGWAAYYLRPGLPALIGLVTAILLLVSKNSPLVVGYRWLRLRRRRRRARRALQ